MTDHEPPTGDETSPIRQSSIVKVATYIASVGEGNTFKKLDMLDAVPGVSQADRRMRDLRGMGWEIDNYKGNPSLRPDEYLLRKIGVRVDQGERPPASARKTISGPKRREVFQRDAYTCQSCFTVGGEAFADEPSRKATLTIGHIRPVVLGGTDDLSNLRAECQRCNDEVRQFSANPPDPQEVLALVGRGSRADKRVLWGWMDDERRTISDMERTFIKWRQLPVEQRREIKDALARQAFREDEN